MQKITVSLIGLMDLGTLDALKSITPVKNPCLPSLNDERNSSAKLFNPDVPDKSGHIHEKEGQPIPVCI
jgi:hypothetical protein